nr:SDR family oxidoreductase [uncultured Acetatifactor sp.]
MGGEMSSLKRMPQQSDITLGTPIANTQIYILDGDLRPVPMGVPGELCIAGEGVGKGYLNRPELTAERFVPNPFAAEENCHGKTMYRTGDLARFRSNGEIEYLGRMDTQVKIRGLRIELGEIESVMASFPGIALCAVADRRDKTGRQYLVGYYTMTCTMDTGPGLDEKALRTHLSARLPKYMVPNYFVHLSAMPMTASGKTDRKSLPAPDFSCQTREYIAPATETEEKLCRLLEELLHVERMGVTDDFFEMGGDSLTAIEFLAKAHDSGISFALQNIFDYPTVRQLCGHMEAGDEEKIRYEAADFDKYRSLLEENVIDESFVPEKKSLGNVLLTGATGFLGAHVLDRLLQEETGKVYCLVRGGETADGKARLRDILRYYFGDRYEAEFADGLDEEAIEKSGANHMEELDLECTKGSDTGPVAEKAAGVESGPKQSRRIIPIVGDIESDSLARDMPRDVQTVIHTAASVKHYGSYAYFHRVNAEGTEHVINYAKSVGARLLHISTLSVSGNSLAEEFAVYRWSEEKFFGESCLYIGQPLDNVYVHSKFEAERAVFDAMLTGLDAKVIRVGNLTSRASDYRFQPNYSQNAFLTRFKAILEFGLFPDYLMHLYSEFSPIDLTAEGIVRIAQYAGKQTVFHLNSNRPIYFDRFVKVVHELGISMEVVEGTAFYQALRGTLREKGTEYMFEAFRNDMDEQGQLVYDSNIHIENDFTVWFLKKVGFEWNEIDLEYIQGYIKYFRGLGYLKV